MEWILILGVLFIAYQSGALSSLGVGPGVAVTPTTGNQLQDQQSQIDLATVGGIPAASTVTGVPGGGASLGLKVGASIGLSAASGAMSAGTIGVSAGVGAALGAATAGVGAVVTIFAALWSAHEARVKQAKSENSAVNIGVQGFDSDIKMVNVQYNSGQIDAQTAIRALQQILAQYFALVGPYVQPGRNGCSDGETCGPMQAVLQKGQQPCVGNIGAACCIGCAPLWYSLYDPGNSVGVSPSGPGAITVLQSGGGISQVKKVFGSSYGATDRAGYTLNWSKVGSL